MCAVDGAEVFDPHSAAAAIRMVREACQRIVALLDEAGLNAPTLPEVGEQLQLDRDTMTRALRELSLNHSIVKVERDAAFPPPPRPMRVRLLRRLSRLPAALPPRVCYAKPWAYRASEPLASWSTWMPCALQCSTRRPAV